MMNKRVSKAITAGAFFTVIGFAAQTGHAFADAAPGAPAVIASATGEGDAGWQLAATTGEGDAGWQ